MYGQYMAHKLPLYLITGILCSIFLGANVILMKNNKSLEAVTEQMGMLDLRKMQMKKDTHEVALRVKTLQGMRPERFRDTSGDEFILKAVDDIRRKMKEDVLVVTTMNRGISDMSLQIEYSFNFDTYPQLLRRLNDLDTMAFPFFRFKSFSFQKDQPDRALCRILGEMVMPFPEGEK